MKESFGFCNPVDEAIGSWPGEELLPGFRDFAADFNQVPHTIPKVPDPSLMSLLGLYWTCERPHPVPINSAWSEPG